MAQKMTVRLVDDLDKSEADETIEVAYEGKHYELDLSRANAEMVRDFFAPLVQAGRPVGKHRPAHLRGGGAAAPVPAAQRNTTTRQDRDAVRAYARLHGLDVPEKGRIEACVWEAYRSNLPEGLRGSKHWKDAG